MSDMESCVRCRALGKPSYFGSPRKCAFQTGEFVPDNWNCGTMNELRNMAMASDPKWSEDSSAALIPWKEGEFLIVGWYKNRGTTQFAGILFDGEMKNLTLEAAEYVLETRQTPPPMSYEVDKEKIADFFANVPVVNFLERWYVRKGGL